MAKEWFKCLTECSTVATMRMRINVNYSAKFGLVN